MKTITLYIIDMKIIINNNYYYQNAGKHLAYNMHQAQFQAFHIYSFIPHNKIGIFTVSILQMWQLKHKEVKSFIPKAA